MLPVFFCLQLFLSPLTPPLIFLTHPSIPHSLLTRDPTTSLCLSCSLPIPLWQCSSDSRGAHPTPKNSQTDPPDRLRQPPASPRLCLPALPAPRPSCGLLQLCVSSTDLPLRTMCECLRGIFRVTWTPSSNAGQDDKVSPATVRSNTASPQVATCDCFLQSTLSQKSPFTRPSRLCCFVEFLFKWTDS